MSQKIPRKSTAVEENDKRQTNSPVKDMKKKMAANAEKEKQATEKPTEKVDKPKPSDKVENKSADKKEVKNGPVAEKSDKKDSKADKQPEKASTAEKQQEKTDSKGAQPVLQVILHKDERADKNAKELPKKDKPKQNGSKHNGSSAATNGDAGAQSDSDDVLLVIDDDQDDGLHPELAYDEDDDPPTPEGAPRSYTRRSQTKPTRTPETPRPASDKQDREANSEESKVLKLKDDVSTDRKLRSADSPKPEAKKTDKPAEASKDKKPQEKVDPSKKTEKPAETSQDKRSQEKVEPGKEGDGKEIDIEIDIEDADEPRTKTDTNYSKSRVKVSPYRRSTRLADQTNTSVAANYTGNNTTMEMDITESSLVEDPGLDDSTYLAGLRTIRGRQSYKNLKELSLRSMHPNRSYTSSNVSVSESSRPTGTVVGRKRKPECELGAVEVATEAEEVTLGKRMRLLERIAQPFRCTAAQPPLSLRRSAEIVGINTDIPLSVPTISSDTFEPEALKTAPQQASLPSTVVEDRADAKRCVIM